MSRTEIGGYLGVCVETVSRTLTRLQTQELINVEGKEMVLSNSILTSEECSKFTRSKNEHLVSAAAWRKVQSTNWKNFEAVSTHI